MKLFAANRHELWISVAVVLSAACFQVVPIGFKGALFLGGAMTLGLLCAINAMLDKDEMGASETYLAGIWLAALLILTPLIPCWVGSIRDFANR